MKHILHQTCTTIPTSQSLFSLNPQTSIQKKITQNISKSNLSQNYKFSSHTMNIFIQKLDIHKNIPLELDKYQDQFTQTKIQKQIDFTQIQNIFQKSVRKINSKKKPSKNWSKQDLILLFWAIQKYNLLNDLDVQEYKNQDWTFISELIPGKSSQQCLFKWLNLKINKYIQKYPWTIKEDQILSQIVNQSQKKQWLEISKTLFIKNQGFKVYRTPKQCRQRWTCFLNPAIKKGLWNAEQDYILLEQFMLNGKKWAQASKVLNGRTENAIKNRFNLIMQKSKAKGQSNQKQYAKELMQKIELNNFVKTSDKTPTNLVFSDFTNLTANDDNFLGKNVRQNKEIQNEQSNLFQQNESILANYGQENKQQQVIKIVRIKKIDIKQILENQIQIYPAFYNSEEEQIEYKQIRMSKKKSMQEIFQRIFKKKVVSRQKSLYMNFLSEQEQEI